MKIKNSDIEMKLIYKVAWSFHNTTGIDLEELIGEASIAYCEALHQWDGESSKASTYAYTVMRNTLIVYIQKKKLPTQSLDLLMEEHHQVPHEPYEDVDYFEEELSYEKLTKGWSDDCKELIAIIFYTPMKFYDIPPKKARGRLIKILRNNGWIWPRIWDAIRDVKSLLRENKGICII